MQELNTAARGKVSAQSAHTGWARSDPKETQAPRRSSDALPPQMGALGCFSSVSLAHSQLIPSLKPVAQCVGPDLRFAPNKSGRPFGESHRQSALQQLVVAEERLRVSRRCPRRAVRSVHLLFSRRGMRDRLRIPARRCCAKNSLTSGAFFSDS
jgi:hypothetical protein